MAHPLSEISIRADWREITQRIVRQDARDCGRDAIRRHRRRSCWRSF